MERTLRVFALALLTASAACLRAGADWDAEGGGHRGKGRRAGASVVIRMQRRDVGRARGGARPPGVREGSRVDYPQRDERGGRITQREATTPPAEHKGVIGNPGVMNHIRSFRRKESVPNRYYWHDNGGVRYCHTYRGGVHWYGFYHGPRFYWTQFHRGYWWWFDGTFDRWVFWRDGYWWWPGPGGVAYVYVDNNYYPADEKGNVTVKTPEVVPPPKEIPAASAGGASWKSPDGKRLVQVFGDHAEAFLYDAAPAQPMFLKYLGKDVEKVRFSGGAGGAPLRILVDYKGGTFALMSGDGDPMDEDPDPSAPAESPAPPPAPTDPPSHAP